MTKPAIEVNELGKLYRLEHAATGSKTFREVITNVAGAPLRRLRQARGTDKSMEDFWALKDVSFDVAPGEVVGIVGRNGAGKSTLLKILSRIVEPTRGTVTMRGRVASLLEVGTGFHPELTGRENIFLNGSILGMKRREIHAQFDAVVAFAEIERFLDTPVKRYSSGMYVRLAFAVAAHLNPEILIVDEVLAVGDAEFQKKCLGKMKEVSTTAGRTVLFVSHNMAAVRSLCSRAVWLRSGQVVANDSAETVVRSYLESTVEAAATTVELRRPAGASIWMNRAQLTFDGASSVVTPMGTDIVLKVCFQAQNPTRHPRMGFVLQTIEGDKLFNNNNRYAGSPEYDVGVTHGTIVCKLGSPPLMPGHYSVSLWMGDTFNDQHIEMDVLSFEVTEKDLWGYGQIPPRGTPLWWPTEFEFHHQAAE